jgi:hypothetical protein
VRLAGAIYGNIVVTAVVASLPEDDDTSSLELVVAALGTVLVFWLAHVYARVLAGGLDGEPFVGRAILPPTTRSGTSGSWSRG